MVPQHPRARRRSARPVAAPRRARVLDAGCGPGGNGAWLAEHGDVVGVDLSRRRARVRARAPSPDDRRRCRRRSRRSRSPTQAFDAVVGITVLYTRARRRDGAARARARARDRAARSCSSNPPSTRSRRAHDATVHGRRRYRRAELAELATAAGLTVQRATYAYSFLAPPAAALAAPRPHPRGASDGHDRAIRRRPARARPGLRASGRARARVARPPRRARRHVGVVVATR